MLVALQKAVEDPELHLPAGVWLALVLGAAVMAVALVRALERGGRRDRGIAHLARARGWRYQSDDPAGIGRLRFVGFSGAGGVHVTNVVSNDAGRVRVFDYSLLVERTRRADAPLFSSSLADDVFGLDAARSTTTREPTRRRSGAIVGLDAFCPSLVAAPAGVLSRVVEATGGGDIDFESVEFNRNWDVRCADRRFAWLFCDVSMIDLILELGVGTTVETFGNYVLFTRDLLASPEDVMAFAATVARVGAIANPLLAQEYPSAAAAGATATGDAWARRPNGHGGLY